MILCSGTLGRIPFRQKAEAAAAAGFTGISIYSREYEPGLRSGLADLGLAVAEVDGAMAWMPHQPGPEPARVLAIAAELGARSCTVIDANDAPVDAGRAADAFAGLCDEAAALGIAMHIEPFAWSGIATLGLATEILVAAGCRNGGIMFDTWHHVRGPDAGVMDPAAARWIAAIQISDPAPNRLPSVRADCMENRRWPGPVARGVVSELRALGCAAPLEVEMFTNGTQPFECALMAAKAFRAVHAAV